MCHLCVSAIVLHVHIERVRTLVAYVERPLEAVGELGVTEGYVAPVNVCRHGLGREVEYHQLRGIFAMGY